MSKNHPFFKYVINILIVFGAFGLHANDSGDSHIGHDLSIERSFDKKNVVPIAVIGGGPAGLTAGLYGVRAGIHTVVFTGETKGGQLTNTTFVENWPGIKKAYGHEIMDVLFEQAESFGAKIVEDTIVKVDFAKWPFVLETESKKTINALSVIVATGAAPRKLGIPGELDYWGKGVSPCAVCDCHFFKNKDVVIIGAGDSAIEEAMILSHYAKNITIIVRKDIMRAAKRMQDKIGEFSNVKKIFNYEVLKIVGDGQVVTGVEIKDANSGKTSVIKCQGVFLAIGQNPNTDLFAPFLQLNRFGYIHVQGRSQATSVPGVFAAGDVEDNEYRQGVVASSSGCKSALEAVKWLRELGLTEHVTNSIKKSYF